MNGEQPVETST